MNRPQKQQETTTTTTINNNNKKTRDLPNLTECHGCGFRIDTCTNGKTNKMQTLYSEWRIVLLCKKCFSRVESSQICSYCFKDSSSSSSSSSYTNCFRCCQCHRSIHKKCFSKHKSVAPWSYSCFSGPAEFSVCVDCWVPKSIASKRLDYCDVNSRVLDEAGKKAEAAVRAREMAVKKAAVARKAVELANGALDLVVAKNSKRNKQCGDSDAELAIRLHRAINSSPRRMISRNLCTLNSTCLDIPKNDGESASIDTSVVSETNASLVSITTTTNVDCLKPGAKVYLRKRKKCGGGGGGGDNEIAIFKWQMKEGEESFSNKLLNSSVDDNNSMNYSESNGERSDGKPDRYLIKYRKRESSSKGIIPNSESKFLYEGFLVECQGSALNCSNESRTFSNTAFQPCALSTQASASCDQS